MATIPYPLWSWSILQRTLGLFRPKTSVPVLLLAFVATPFCSHLEYFSYLENRASKSLLLKAQRGRITQAKKNPGFTGRNINMGGASILTCHVSLNKMHVGPLNFLKYVMCNNKGDY